MCFPEIPGRGHRMRLTKPAVARLSLPEGKQEAIYFDDLLPGFGVRLRAGGKKTWIVQYRVGHRQRRLTLGALAALDLDKARETARERLANVTLGTDPAAERKLARARANLTLGSIVTRYLAHKEPRMKPRGYAEAKRALERHWKPLHGIGIDTVDRAAVAERLAAIAQDSGPVAADRARANLSALFGWAMREGIAATNPVMATNLHAGRVERERVLSEAELAEIWQASRDDDYGRIIKLLILTGARRGEVGGMRWAELDLDKALWTLPPNRVKNGRLFQVPLSDLAIETLRAQPRQKDRDHVFGAGQDGYSGWTVAKTALDRRILRARTESVRKGAEVTRMPDWVVHDIRRSVATHLAGKLAIPPHVVEAVLNHISSAASGKAGVAGIYNRSTYLAEKRTALAIWGEQIRAGLSSKSALLLFARTS